MTAEQELNQLRAQYQAVCELLWQTVATCAPDTHRLTVAPAAENPLWELTFLRADEGKKIEICAATIPELDEQTKKKLVRMLRGTDKKLTDAMTELELRHPAAYLVQKLSDRIVYKVNDEGSAGSWASVGRTNE